MTPLILILFQFYTARQVQLNPRDTLRWWSMQLLLMQDHDCRLTKFKQWHTMEIWRLKVKNLLSIFAWNLKCINVNIDITNSWIYIFRTSSLVLVKSFEVFSSSDAEWRDNLSNEAFYRFSSILSIEETEALKILKLKLNETKHNRIVILARECKNNISK